ncbi:MAG: hypothetical protein SFV81_28600 [Pirellulaceae bacterium]|nr:hypothetical protein [Pirellulaceae bacterium]
MQLTWLVGKQLLEASKRIDDWMFQFEGDSTLIIECLWRLVDTTQIVVASLDQGQRSTIWVNRAGNDEMAIVFRDAGQELIRCLYNARIHSAIVRPITNDVQIDFDNGMSLQLVSDRSSCGGWCMQSPSINLVAIGSQLALHAKQAELVNDEQRDGPESPNG